MSEPVIVHYVSAVEGRLVQRWGTSQFFGARITSDKQREAGAPPIAWDLERVYALTEDFVTKHPREVRQALKNRDLKARTEQDFQAWKKAEAERREAAEKAAEEAKTAAADAEAAGSDESSDDDGDGDEEAPTEAADDGSDETAESESEEQETNPAPKRRGRKGK